MFGRVAACAALILLSPVCAGRTTLPPGAGAAFAQEPSRNAVKQKNVAELKAPIALRREANLEPPLPRDPFAATSTISRPTAAITQEPPRDAAEQKSVAELETPTALQRDANLELPLPRGPVAATSTVSETRMDPGDAEPFGRDARPVASGAILSKWSGVRAEIRAETEILASCRSGAWCPQSARRFLAIVDEGRMKRGLARVGAINRAMNLAIVPTTDLAQWGVADRWSGPLETLATSRGDCKDYAIAKYVALKAAGVADRDVRLVVVHDVAVGENHAVVAVRLDGAWVILDNRWLALVQDRQMPRTIPLFVLDGDGVREFVNTAPMANAQDGVPGAL
jgi:predicted transglutaminase-like cysteine proteinase